MNEFHAEAAQDPNGRAPFHAHDAERALLRRFDGVIRGCAWVIARHNGVDPNDLWSAGAMGVLDAARRFDETRGVKLETFVGHRVRGAMLDELRRQDRLPRRLRGKLAVADKTRESLHHQLGRDPTRGELANALHVATTIVDSLEIVREPPARPDVLEGVPADLEPTDAVVAGAEEKATVDLALEHLSERQRTVLALRYVEQLTLRACGEVMGISEPRVSQLIAAAMKNLRRELRVSCPGLAASRGPSPL